MNDIHSGPFLRFEDSYLYRDLIGKTKRAPRACDLGILKGNENAKTMFTQKFTYIAIVSIYSSNQ